MLRLGKGRLDYTLENHRVGALKGIVYDKDGTVLYNFFTEFNDFAPRDSFSITGVVMWCYPANPPFVMPQSVVTEIDNPAVQTQLQPFLDYGDVAAKIPKF